MGVVLGLLGRSRTIQQDTATEASKDALLRADVEYIKRGVDDVRLEQRAQGQHFDALAERVTRVEESTKQAHHTSKGIRELPSSFFFLTDYR